jgi:hypothetical protein
MWVLLLKYERRRFAHIVDIALVRNAHHVHTFTLERLGVIV